MKTSINVPEESGVSSEESEGGLTGALAGPLAPDEKHCKIH